MSPELPAQEADIDRWRAEVADACRVLAAEGLVSGILGHVSVRVGEDRMLIRARSTADPGLLLSRPQDVVLADFDGNAAEELGDRRLPQELPIHGQLLRERPGDNAVVHAHPPDVVLCSIADLPLRPVFGAFNIPAMRLAERGLPTFGYYGLIRSAARGREMVAAMAGAPAIVLRGHGLTAAAATLAGAVVTALNINVLAHMTAVLGQLGRRAAAVPDADRAQLPDLGPGFNDDLVWRHYRAKLRHYGLAVLDGPPAGRTGGVGPRE